MNNSGLKILGSLTSPYVRLVRSICEELKLPYEMILTQPFTKMTPDQHQMIKDHNPLFRVPVLIDHGKEIFESRIISYYLLNKPEARDSRLKFPLSIEQENILSTIYGAVEAGTTGFMLTRSDAGLDPSKGYFPKFRERIESSYAWLEYHLQNGPTHSLGEQFGVCEIALICCLEWMKKRAVFNWDSGYPNLKSVYERFKDQPALVATRMPENA